MQSALKNEFKDRQLSDATFNNLQEVDLNHTFHQKILQQRFAEIARNLGDPNVFTEVDQH